jgi:hypothetical protein
MRNVSNRSCEEYETHILFVQETPPEIGTVFERMWKECGTAVMAVDHSIIRRMRFACWVNKATNTQNNTFCFFYGSSM